MEKSSGLGILREQNARSPTLQVANICNIDPLYFQDFQPCSTAHVTHKYAKTSFVK